LVDAERGSMRAPRGRVPTSQFRGRGNTSTPDRGKGKRRKTDKHMVE
jgi:hypothetical protein